MKYSYFSFFSLISVIVSLEHTTYFDTTHRLARHKVKLGSSIQSVENSYS